MSSAPNSALDQHDPLTDFEARQVSLLGSSKRVYVAGRGPAVIVMAELPGITPHVARFARWVREAGFTVYLPSLFGKDGAPAGRNLRAMGTLLSVCVSREFSALASHRSSPVADWLRALARLAHSEAGGKGVGAVGMCFTGNFAVSLMLEPVVKAPVLCQPSLPLTNPAGLHASREELAQVRARLEAEDLTMLAYRFEGDPFCRAPRFEGYAAALGPRFCPRVLEDSDAAAHPALAHPHSVVTLNLVDDAGSPTRKAVEEILELFRTRLKA